MNHSFGHCTPSATETFHLATQKLRPLVNSSFRCAQCHQPKSLRGRTKHRLVNSARLAWKCSDCTAAK